MSLANTSAAGRVVGFRNDRLGARLNVVANARRLAQSLDAPLGVVWPKHEMTSPELQHPEELFSERFVNDHFLSDTNFTSLMADAVLVDNVAQPPTRADVLEILQNGGTVLCNDALNISCLADETPGDVKADLAHQISHDILNPVVSDALAHLESNLPKGSSVAYHLRRGDIIDPKLHASQTLWSGKYVPRVYYEVHMRRLLAHLGDNLTIIVFSDAPGEITKFRAAGLPVKSMDDVIDTRHLTAIQRDSLELLAMARCKPIYAPAASAFSTVAASLGPSVIVPLVEDLPVEDQNRAVDVLTERLLSDHGSFLGDADLGQNLPFMIDYQRAKGRSDICLRILKDLDARGFDRAYLPNLLARELFFGQDWLGTQVLLDRQAEKPVPSRSASTQATQYAAMTALCLAPFDEAFPLAGAAIYAGPLHPNARLMMALLAQDAPPDTMPPVDMRMLRGRKVIGGKFAEEQVLMLDILAARDGLAGSKRHMYPQLTTDLDIRDWRYLHRPNLPPLFQSQARISASLKKLRETFASMPDHPTVLSTTAVLLRDAGDHEAALKNIDLSLKVEPDVPLYLKRRGDILATLNRPDEALQAYRDAVATAPGNPFYLSDLGTWLVQNGQRRQGLDRLEEATTLPHDFVGLHLHLARMLRPKRSRDLAYKMARRALDILPTEISVVKTYLQLLELDNERQLAEHIRSRLPK